MNIGNMILMPVLADPAWGGPFHLGGDRGWWAGGVCSTRTRSRLVALVCVCLQTPSFACGFSLGKNKILSFEKFLMLDFICIFKSAA